VRSEDYHWLHALITPGLFTSNARRLAREGVPPNAADRGVSAVARSLSAEGPLTRAELAERIAAIRVPVEGQALVHLLLLASLRGLVVRGPLIGGEQAYALTRDWLGEPPSFDREPALAELARRYLAGHGPAGDRDLAKWAGVTLGGARAGLRAIGSELARRPDGLLDLAQHAPVERQSAPRLLGAFDPVLLGWRSRREILGPQEAEVVRGGMFRAFALVRGRAAATWKLDGGELVLAPFRRLSREDLNALRSDAEDVVRFLGAASGGADGARDAASGG
jgi:Winged helix DNA-binding domain